MAARRRLRHPEPLASGDARPPEAAPERDVDPGQRRALATRAAARQAGGHGVVRGFFAGASPTTWSSGSTACRRRPSSTACSTSMARRSRTSRASRRSPSPDEQRLLAGVRDGLVVFGHSHQQFRRPGPDGTELLNPGSVGMPLDGDTRAAWAVRDDDGRVRFPANRVRHASVRRTATASSAASSVSSPLAGSSAAPTRPATPPSRSRRRRARSRPGSPPSPAVRLPGTRPRRSLRPRRGPSAAWW